MKSKWRELETTNIEEANVVICGIPYDEACSCAKGAALAPETLRELSTFLPPISYDGSIINIKVFDNGDVKNFNPYKLDDLIGKTIDAKKFCLFLGGDHSVTVSSQKVFIEKNKGKKIGIIHCDAHMDLCDIYDDNKYSHACVNRRAIDNGIGIDDIVYIGIRSWEKQEIEYIKSHKEMLVFSMNEIRKNGINNIINNVINRFKNYDAIYLSLDIDIVDPAYAPGTGTPEAGGLVSLEFIDLVTKLVMNLPIHLMDIVEVSPPLDINNITSWLALKVIYEVFHCIDIKKI